MGNHDLPEGFKMTELGPLPEGWEVVRLGEVAEFSRNSLKREGLSGQMPFLPMSLIPENSLYITRWEFREPSQVRSGIKIANGDLLLAKITPCLENGKQGIVTGLPNEIGLATTEVIPIRPLKPLITEFLASYLKVPPVRKSLADKMEGTTGRQRLPKSVVISLLIPLPPLPEQRAIAQVLRTVQRAREATEKVITALKELKKSLMRHLFTYGPVPVDQVDQVRLKETEIGPLPEGWEVVKLGEVFEIQQGKALSPKARAGPRRRPFLRTANVYWGKIDLSTLDEMHFDEDEEARLALQVGDILVCEGGDIGRTAIWEGQLESCLYQNHLHRLRATRSDIEPQFYMYWMQAAWLLLGLYGGVGNKTTIPNLSRSRLAAFGLPLAPLPEQRAIADILRTVDRKLEAEERRKTALDSLFKTLLHHLMTGKVRVGEVA